MTDKSAIYELRMAGISEQDAINDAEFIARKQRTIDALVAALSLVKSMRTVDALSPAEHQFEIEKRRDAWAKIDSEIDAALALVRGEG